MHPRLALGAGCANGVGVGVGYSGPKSGTGVNTGTRPSTILDDDGNAVFIFKGVSYLEGPSQVIADVLAGTGDTFVTHLHRAASGAA